MLLPLSPIWAFPQHQQAELPIKKQTWHKCSLAWPIFGALQPPVNGEAKRNKMLFSFREAGQSEEKKSIKAQQGTAEFEKVQELYMLAIKKHQHRRKKLE